MMYEFSFTDQCDYENKVEVEIRLKSSITTEDQKILVDAIETIKSTMHPYLVDMSTKLRAEEGESAANEKGEV